MSDEMNINLPFERIVSDKTTSKGSRKVFELESGWYFILETGVYAEGSEEITIQKELPDNE